MIKPIFVVCLVLGLIAGAIDIGFCVQRTDLAGMKTEVIVKSEIERTSIEWKRCKNRELQTSHPLQWRINIESISSFGGLYAKGYLQGNKAFPVQLRWDQESDYLRTRKPTIVQGDIIDIKATFWGVSEMGAVIITVTQIYKIK
jgi:hypothetical protein